MANAAIIADVMKVFIVMLCFLVIDRLNDPKLPGAANLGNSAWAEGQKLSVKRTKVSL
jgi:hypothetical protein